MKECVDYFKNRPVYDRLFHKVREKYASLGHMGGTVTLTKLTDEDRQQLGGFFKKDYHGNRSVTISWGLMQRALGDSKFAELQWEDILESYFGEPLKSKRERQQQKAKKWQQYFERIADKMNEKSRRWLMDILEKRSGGYHILQQQYKENPVKLEEALGYISQAVSSLPAWEQRTERLPVFAARITGNPHYFDEGTLGERLLTAYLKSVFVEKEQDQTQAERKNSLLYKAGILKDDLSNFVLAYGIEGTGKGGELHEGLEGFRERKEPVILTLYTVSRLEKARGQSEASNKIYVVENPAVFSTLIEKYPQIAIVCTNGQPRLAALVLLDMLKDNHTFYYAGDFDPEGLLIAQNLKIRYGEKLVFWKYETAYYEKSLSDVVLDMSRLRKLDKVQSPELMGIKVAMLEKQRAAYQENILDVYIT